MKLRTLLLGISVVGLGLFVMPSTLSLFSGQHTFYNGTSVKCEKCHADILDEIDNLAGSGSPHQTITSGTGKAICKGCHTTGTVNNVPINGTTLGSYTENVTNNTNAHAAVTLECIACHSGVDEEITGSEAAHAEYYYNASENNQTAIDLKGSNTACVGCHTHITINITWTRTMGYNLTADETSGTYNLTFSTNTTADNIKTTYSAGS
ncbi:MAG: cytochrome c3 family protein [Methanosarcinales archaeon]